MALSAGFIHPQHIITITTSSQTAELTKEGRSLRVTVTDAGFDSSQAYPRAEIEGHRATAENFIRATGGFRVHDKSPANQNCNR
jgi:hypothetical protein